MMMIMPSALWHVFDMLYAVLSVLGLALREAGNSK